MEMRKGGRLVDRPEFKTKPQPVTFLAKDKVLKAIEVMAEKKYHQWVYASDDILNKILKLCVCSLYGYGIYVFTLEIWSKFFKV